MNVLVFDIETIPDIESGQKIFDLQGLDDKSTAKAMAHLQQQKTGSDFLPLYLQKIVAISVVYRGMADDMGNIVTVRSLGDHNSSEAELLELFIDEIKERTPILVSWNGSGFDLPVIHYRMLKNGVSVPESWETGDTLSFFSGDDLSNNHQQHTDLKNVLARYNQSAKAPLDHISTLLGFPGKNGMDGSMVWATYQADNLSAIRNYCETDVLNTYLVYLQYQLMLGKIDKDERENEFMLLQEMLDDSGKEHLLSFSKQWATNRKGVDHNK